MKFLLSLTINFDPIPSVHSLRSEMIIVLCLLVLCICSFSCNIMLEMVLHGEKSPKPFASALVSVVLAFTSLLCFEYGNNQNRNSGWHWLQQVSFWHTFPGIWSPQATVLLLIRVIQSQYRLGRSSFWCAFSIAWTGKSWAQLVFQLFPSIVTVHFVAGFILSRAQGRHVFSFLCAYPHWWLLASLTTQLIGSGLKIWFGADFCFRPSRKKHGTARLICPLQFNHGRRSVCWSSILFCNRNSRCLVCFFFFCPGWRRIANPDGGWPLGSAALSSLHVCNSVLHLSICHYGCV